MQDRYVVVVRREGRGRGTPARDIGRSTGLPQVFGSEQVTVFSDQRRPLPAQCAKSQGLLLGWVFSKDGDGRAPIEFGETESAEILRSNGRALTAQVWGGYVGVVDDPQAHRTMIIRDPSGAMPCYYIERDGMVAFASDAPTLAQSGLFDPAVDWAYVGEHLLSQEYRTSATGLVGLKELLPGHSFVSGSSGCAVSANWSPWDHVAAEPEPAAGQEAERLAAVIRQCVHAWASRFEHILLGVSGGLDSSIVAACLSDQAVPFSLVTRATQDPEGDERPYARVLAQALDMPLFEEFYDLKRVEVEKSTAAHLPRPDGRMFPQEIERIHLGVARTVKADALFNGLGGDNVFCFMNSATPIVDRVRQEGWGRGVFETLDDICGLTGCSIWDAGFRAAKKAMAPVSRYRWKGDVSFLSPRLAAQPHADVGRTAPHEWLVAPPGAPPGKSVHISMILRAYSALESYARDAVPPVVSPLLSQPVVEHCLRIPTWRWCEGGVDRAVARRAFANLLPDRILRRRSKGGPDSFCVEVMMANRKRLMPWFLDGLLAKHDIIDRDAIETVLRRTSPPPAPDYLRILALADAEGWARTWDSYPAFVEDRVVRAGLAH